MSPRRLDAELMSGHRQVGSGARNTTKQPTGAKNRKKLGKHESEGVGYGG